MNVGIGTVSAQFLAWEYLFRIFGIVSLQCGVLNSIPKFQSPPAVHVNCTLRFIKYATHALHAAPHGQHVLLYVMHFPHLRTCSIHSAQVRCRYFHRLNMHLPHFRTCSGMFVIFIVTYYGYMLLRVKHVP
jgi:hypothetical protein